MEAQQRDLEYKNRGERTGASMNISGELHANRPGTIAVLRESWRGKLWTARPFRVVRDTPTLIALHMMPGSVCKHPGAVSEFLPDEWTVSDRPWTGGDMLCLHEPGRWQAVWLFWSPPPERRFLHWYVNLQEPLRRTRLGFDYLDQELDLVIDADRSWYWKDEAAFRSAIARGRIAPEREVLLRREGQRTLAEMRSGDWVADRWTAWTPPAHWTPLTLLVGWDVLDE